MTGAMQGKVMMVTGANVGIGLATAKGLARQGAHVVMVARSRSKGEAALSELKRELPGAQATLLLADLSKQADIRALASEFKRHFDRLDVLINNAAIIPAKREVNADGLEMQFAVNHLAPFLLTHLLLDVLRASAPSRIVNVSSSAHTEGKIDLDDLQHARIYDMPRFPLAGWQAYSNTKLLNVLFTYALARRLEGTSVTANCLHPGVISTQLVRTSPWIFQRIYGLVMPKPERGARTSIYLATSPEVAGVSGQYFGDNCNALPSSDASHDRALQEQIWAISERLAGIAVPASV